MEGDDDLARVTAALDQHGLLPVQHPGIPSVCALVAGEEVRGSWWGHPAGGRIYAALGRVDALAAKLLWGKVTLVHPRLQAAVAALGGAVAPWQTDGLGDEARDGWARVVALGEARSDALGPGAGRWITELERRWLVWCDEVHTEGGRHARVVRPWSAWRPERPRPEPEPAREAILAAAAGLGAARGLPVGVQ